MEKSISFPWFIQTTTQNMKVLVIVHAFQFMFARKSISPAVTRGAPQNGIIWRIYHRIKENELIKNTAESSRHKQILNFDNNKKRKQTKLNKKRTSFS